MVSLSWSTTAWLRNLEGGSIRSGTLENSSGSDFAVVSNASSALCLSLRAFLILTGGVGNGGETDKASSVVLVDLSLSSFVWCCGCDVDADDGGTSKMPPTPSVWKKVMSSK